MELFGWIILLIVLVLSIIYVVFKLHKYNKYNELVVGQSSYNRGIDFEFGIDYRYIEYIYKEKRYSGIVNVKKLNGSLEGDIQIYIDPNDPDRILLDKKSAYINLIIAILILTVSIICVFIKILKNIG